MRNEEHRLGCGVEPGPAHQRALLELQRFERIAALEWRIFEHAFAAFDQVEQQLGGPVSVQALLLWGRRVRLPKCQAEVDCD